MLLLPALATLGGCGKAVLLSPSGDVAVQLRDIILVSTGLMLLIIVPVIAATLWFAWRYRESNTSHPYTPDADHSTILELLIWAAPLLIIIALSALTWVSTHKLDVFRPLERLDAQRPVPAGTKPLEVQVVALDWKWLFLYPEQGIATVNELAAPVDRPIEFKITASSVMNSFFIPALAGQVYAMPGMQTRLHAVINHPGVYEGFSANYSGAGFSQMRFTFHGVSQAEFDQWVQTGKTAGKTLDAAAYQVLAQPSVAAPVQRFSAVDPGLYQAILRRCTQPGGHCASAPAGTHTTASADADNICRAPRQAGLEIAPHSMNTAAAKTASAM